MAEVYLSDLAKQDLADAKQYIANDLQNPEAAKKTITRILNFLHVLAQFPLSGAPLYISGVQTGYRSMVSGSYRIFYHGDKDVVYVVRILYGRRNFMRILFNTPMLPTDDE